VLKDDTADPVPGTAPFIEETFKELIEAVLKDDTVSVEPPNPYCEAQLKNASL
jgi:hypothetical protein